MTNQEVYDYIEEYVDNHENNEGKSYIADDYIKEGYGQIKGGYLAEAYKCGLKLLKEEAEPSQKWHILVAYYDYKKTNSNKYPKFNMNNKADLGRILCPQLMLWIAEIAGLNRDLLKEAKKDAIKYAKENDTRDSRKIKSAILNEKLHWIDIISAIKKADTWNEVIKKVSMFKS